MFEVADTSENHRHSSLIGGSDNLLVTHRTTRLDCAGRPRIRGRNKSVREWEKRIAAYSTTLK
jgi:hypothetical protein